jgi:hypothetical protein
LISQKLWLKKEEENVKHLHYWRTWSSARFFCIHPPVGVCCLLTLGTTTAAEQWQWHENKLQLKIISRARVLDGFTNRVFATK